MIAFLEAKKAGLFARKYWPRNLVSGLIISVIAIPLGMAFAIASGAKPEQGIYTAIVAGLCVSLFGGSRVQIAGPTGAFVMLLSGIGASHGMAGLQTATIMAGAMLVCMGLAKFGGVIKFIPKPVIVGFTAGIGVVLCVGQWQYFFGLPKTGGGHFHEKAWALLQVLPQFHPATLGLAVVSILTIIFFPKIKKFSRIPSPLIAMLLATGLQTWFDFPGVKTIGNAFGGIAQSPPTFVWPASDLATIFTLVGPAFTIAILGAIESLLSAVVADGMTDTRHDSNQELIGQGIANIFSPLFGGIAATGAIARTATNVRNGGNSPLSGIIQCAALFLVVLFFAPAASYIPLAAMAAILFVVAYNMSDVKYFVYMIRQAPAADVIILLVTFLLTVFADLVVAVNVGVLLAILHFMKRMTASVDVHKVSSEELGNEPERALPKGTIAYAIEGPLFFGAVERFERTLAYTNTYPKILIIRLYHVPFADMTAIETLKNVIVKLKKRNVRTLLTEANNDVRYSLHKAGIFSVAGKRIYWKDFASALERSRKILAAAENKTAAGKIRPPATVQ
ncbi:MAG: STAS domain-containing protein [Acidaminococcales bacterium]|jgi:SulP family sulfate permease|nr:STAS domain-containing protein [Acidaminococcales bacterium]